MAGRSETVWQIKRAEPGWPAQLDRHFDAEQGRMLILSAEPTTRQLTADAAYRRNLIAAAFAHDVVCAYATPDGATAQLTNVMQKLGKACMQLVEAEQESNNE